ncbi:MAG: 3' terminal RNA ribose 2'-O-methyltransferase Hen1 [Candidatus Dormibacteria bacterium]
MILTISTTHRPATDLGLLLHKNPSHLQSFEVSVGVAHVFYPYAGDELCQVALVLDVDPIGLVRNHRGGGGDEFSLGQYVNDRPYALSSLMSVTLAKVFGTAMAGRSRERPELVDQPLPLEVQLPVVPSRGGEGVLRRLFEPIGYEVTAHSLELDPAFPAWGESRFFAVTLRTNAPLRSVLGHLYVLLPVLDDDKHYWVGADEVDKLLRRGGAWLADHPERELIALRYLRHDRRLTRDALARLADEGEHDPDAQQEGHDAEEQALEKPLRLGDERIAAVVTALREVGAARVLDLGCGSGKLVRALLKEQGIEQVVGVDVSVRALEVAAKRLHLDTMAPRQRQRVQLLQSALTYRDRRLEGFDAAAIVEVIEHLEPSRLQAFSHAVFGRARPQTVVITTPNLEYNPHFESLPAGSLRHRDHRFEWTRDQFQRWSAQAAQSYGYEVDHSGIGPRDPGAGQPTQMAVFRR